MKNCRKDKSKKLANKLLTLDIDEGIRIDSSIQEKKIFINKTASGIFVVELITRNALNSDIRYFDFVNDVIKFVKSSFNKRFLISDY
ncbi:MAG: hypothetical protein JO327_00430 [Nitrososphaeraceae archaeon]|nr:hypothetical protein [Nitrososphaeraceae archaeon]MBV9666573.1 hypothetical protein [Nitrososphaeraceae archaeon]